MNYSVKRVLVLVFLVLPWGAWGSPAPSLIVDTIATREIREGNYRQAFAELTKYPTPADTAFYWYRMGLISAGLSNRSGALHAFMKCVSSNASWKPFVYQQIGQLEERNKNTAAALMAYRTALDASTLTAQKKALRAQLYSLYTTDSLFATNIPWLDSANQKSELTNETWVVSILDTMLSTQSYQRADTLLGRFDEKSTRTTIALMGVLKRRMVPDTAFSSTRFMSLARISSACREYSLAQQFLTKSIHREGTGILPNNQQDFLFAIGLYFKLGDYSRVTALVDKYDRKFGASSQSMLLLARSFRKLGKTARADYWYDRFISLYPTSPETIEILWYRAWQREAEGKYLEAIPIYKTISKRFPASNRGDVSLFRIGLCLYKNRIYDSAQAIFAALPKQFSASNFIPAAEYWRGKSAWSQADTCGAKTIFCNLLQAYPYYYYAFRAREMLLLLGDSITARKPWIDTLCTPPRAALWLDSVTASKTATLDSAESTVFRMGASLLFCGYPDLGRAILIPLDVRYAKFSSFSYNLARLYARFGDPTISYRSGLRLLGKIPTSTRDYMPLDFYSLIYPAPVFMYVYHQANLDTIPWHLVYAVMRQESMFDADIQSPAGAVGLMQIMPQTGRTLARQLNTPFATDSLFNPFVNIRFGAFYLSQLLKEFKGNMILAIAAYNAGPDRAHEWGAKGAAIPPDLFIENIEFTETREYVKKVLGNFWTYSALGPRISNLYTP